MESVRAPPKWLQAWCRFVSALFHAEMLLARVMIQATRLRIRPRSWLVFQDPMFQTEMETLFGKATSPCTHDQIQRSGNKFGRYSRCVMCNKKWVWSEDLQAWTEPKASKAQRQLPLPSSSTATTFQDKTFVPAKHMGLNNWDLRTQSSSSTTTPKAPAIKDRGYRPKSSPAKSKKRSARSKKDSSSSGSDYDWTLLEGVP